MSAHKPSAAAPAGWSSKVQEEHLTRLGVVYVRQSTPQQVLEHRESTARQYDLIHRAELLGWPPQRTLLIDEDQGQSGGSAEGRLGFQRLLAEVAMDHVGIVLSLEVSRLARSNKDWHQLLEVCAVFGVLIADQDGVYDPRDFNDRLLLGLKGTMSEVELHILAHRLADGLRQKAQRGEALNHPPIGFVRVEDDYVIDADEQVQTVVRLIFDQFERQGSLHGLLRYLAHHQVRIPVRPHHGPNRGRLEWRRPNRVTLQNVLKHPIYAGAYRWGHRKIDPRKKKPGRRNTGRTVQRPEDCDVLIHDRFPPYISWERFLSNLKRLSDNRARAESRGATRSGPSLLSGLVVCGRCGRRLVPSYSGSYLRYSCARAMIDYAEPLCQSLAGRPLDAFVAEQMLAVVQPAALELSLTAADDIEREREQLHQHWRQRLERARYDAERAARQYQAVEPENRLVARALERQWNESLAAQQQLEEQYARFVREQPRKLTRREQEEIRALSRDLPAVWSAASTTPQDKQQIARLLLERVVVEVLGNSEQVRVTLHWQGGAKSERQIVRPIDCYEHLSYFPRMCARIEALHAQGCASEEIAKRLNAEGFRPPKRTDRFNGAMVTHLLWRAGHDGPRPRAATAEGVLAADEWWISDLARHLDMPLATLHRWRKVGWVQCRKLPIAGGRWAIWADADELDRLRRLRACPLSWADRPMREDLIVPKPRPEGPANVETD